MKPRKINLQLLSPGYLLELWEDTKSCHGCSDLLGFGEREPRLLQLQQLPASLRRRCSPSSGALLLRSVREERESGGNLAMEKTNGRLNSRAVKRRLGFAWKLGGFLSRDVDFGVSLCASRVDGDISHAPGPCVSAPELQASAYKPVLRLAPGTPLPLGTFYDLSVSTCSSLFWVQFWCNSQ